MLLSRFPRAELAHLPTPLEYLPRLSRHLGGPEIYVKRDDCTGLAMGGNKTRKLEFVMGDALAKGADTVITVGAVQSNHVRQTAAAACRLGLKCHILLEQRIDDPGELYATSGNVLLDRLFGAELSEHSAGTDFDQAMEHLAGEIRAAGGKPYVIAGGASMPVGALGYVNCAMELLVQGNERGIAFDHVVTATGSAGTQAGLLVGLKATHSGLPLTGIGVGAPEPVQRERVRRLAVETAELIGAAGVVASGDIDVNCDYIGEGYGIPTPAMNDALLLLARLEGLLFDPVYSGKALAGLIDLIDKKHFERSDKVVFLHTGGSPALFAYADQLDIDRR